MNATNNAPSSDRNLDPIAEALRRAASEVTLRRGSHVSVVRAAKRRQHRRRQAVAASAVIAVGGGTVLTIQQLTRSTTPTLRSPVDDGTSVVDSVQDTAAPSVETSPPNDPNAAGSAVLVEPDLVWNVVTPDVASSVGFAYSQFDLPGMVISTAPGRSNEMQPAVWRTDDGITWEQVDVDLPVGSVHAASIDGNRIYSVGTAPNIAATDPNPLLFASSGDAGSTWSTITLPIDSNADADLPYVRSAHATAHAAPIIGGVLVSVNHFVDLDTERLGLGDFSSWSADGVVSRADPDCRPAEQSSGMVIATTTTILNTATAGDLGGCEMVTRPWSDFDVPRETVAAMFERPSRLFHIDDDGSFSEIESPVSTGWFSPAGVGQGPNPIFIARGASGPGGWYRYRDDGTWQELQVWPDMYDVRSAGDGIIGIATNGYSTTQIAMSRDGSNWTRTDLSGLYDEPSHISTWQSTTSTSGALTMVVSSAPDPIAAQGGAEITIGGVTARIDRAGGQVTIADDATGEPIDPAFITDTYSGVSVKDIDGNVRALFPIDMLFANLMSPVGTDTSHWEVIRTSDGVSFSRESIPELLGLTQDDISSVAYVATSGSKVIVAVRLTERDDDGVPKQLVLVGTPRG